MRVRLAVLVLAGLVACGGSLPKAVSSRGDGSWVVLRVERVQISPTRPGSDFPWDLPSEQGGDSGCGLLGALSEIALPGIGAVAGGLCTLGASDRPAREYDPRGPDLFVRLGFNETVYRSYVVPDRFDYVLDFDVLVPLELVPADGIDVRVLDKDGDSDSDFELIGLVRVLRSDLVPGRRLRLANAGVQTLELKVEAAPQTERRTAVDMNASDGMVRAGIRVPAGAALTIRATGAYQVGSYYDAEITSDGYPGGGPSDYNLKSQPFRVAAHGAAVAILTAGSLAEGVVIGVCTHFIASGGGDLVLGINDREPRNNVGLVQFVVVTALPTIAEWRQAGVSHGCGAP